MTISNLEFVDTNVLIYAFETGDTKRHKKAKEKIAQLAHDNRGALSAQVLIEFYSITTGKLRFPPSAARSAMLSFKYWALHSPQRSDVLQAIVIQQQHQLSWWDALIVNSAQQLNASILWTEDLNHNQRIGNVTVRNPFLD